MNLVEHYIQEIYSEEESPVSASGRVYVDVCVKVDCYGRVEVVRRIVEKQMWEREKKQGFYLA